MMFCFKTLVPNSSKICVDIILPYLIVIFLDSSSSKMSLLFVAQY